MFVQGDLLFTQIGPNDDAISSVTEGLRGARLNHVGVVLENARGVFVLEAFPPEVRVTSLAVHLRRSEKVVGLPRYIQLRLKEPFRLLIPEAIGYGLVQRNVPYDSLYLTDEKSLYCSELVVDMFRQANNGREFFPEEPMSFRDKRTGALLPTWISYYERFGMAVPEGEPGSNPGSISRDARLDEIGVSGPPYGYV